MEFQQLLLIQYDALYRVGVNKYRCSVLSRIHRKTHLLFEKPLLLFSAITDNIFSARAICCDHICLCFVYPATCSRYAVITRISDWFPACFISCDMWLLWFARVLALSRPHNAATKSVVYGGDERQLVIDTGVTGKA